MKSTQFFTVLVLAITIWTAQCAPFGPPYDKPVSSFDGKTANEVLSAIVQDLKVDDPAQKKAALARAFTRLHRYVHSEGIVPLSTFWGIDRGGPVDRPPLDAFFQKYAHLVPQGSTCLEWQTDSDDFAYAKRLLPGCKDIWDISYGDTPAVDEAKRIARLDVNHGGEQVPHLRQRFDVIIATQVWGYLKEPARSTRALYYWLKPGGLLFFTAPFIQNLDNVPADHFRYTFHGVKHLLVHAGFEVKESYAAGDVMLSAAFIQAWGVADLSEDEVKASQRLFVPTGKEDEDKSYLLSMHVCYKPQADTEAVPTYRKIAAG